MAVMYGWGGIATAFIRRISFWYRHVCSISSERPNEHFRNIYEGGESFGCGEFHLTVFRCSDKQLPFVSIPPEFSGRPCGGITACFIRKVSFLIFSILRRL